VEVEMATVAYEQKRMLRISDVARRLDCSETTVRRLIAMGQLKAGQFAGPNTSVRISEDVLEAWLEERFAKYTLGRDSGEAA
jgi:excisionase family DNA binding protein